MENAERLNSLKRDEYSVLNDNIEKLKSLKSKGVLSENEFDEKSKQLDRLRLEYEYKKTKDYIDLCSLYEDGLLNKEQFDSKSDMLLGIYKESKNVKPVSLNVFFYALVFIIIYPFFLQYLFGNFFKNYTYNEDWQLIYWGVSLLICFILPRKKLLFLILLLIAVIYSFLTNSKIYLF